MAAYPNIYPNVVLDLPHRLKDLLLDFARNGQIDCDTFGHPYLLRVAQLGRGVQAMVVRGGKLASIIMNPRARTASPELSWNPQDGYRAQTQGPVQVGPADRRERQMREAEDYTRLVNQLWEAVDVRGT
jgi:hypothetical protein